MNKEQEEALNNLEEALSTYLKVVYDREEVDMDERYESYDVEARKVLSVGIFPLDNLLVAFRDWQKVKNQASVV